MMQRILFILLTIILFTEASLKGETGPSKCVLVVGGAGFIGSHINEMLYRKGYKTIVLDNLQQGNRQNLQSGIFIEGNISDTALLNQIFSSYHIDAVMHFAALKAVDESMSQPLDYYINNVAYTLNLLKVMIQHDIKVFIFSSSAAIFGTPLEDYITESHPCQPINPYGQSKLMIETILKDLDRVHDLRFCSFRYFNVAGGDPEEKLKGSCSKSSNLIPIVLQSLLKPDGCVTIYGTDYPTPDGTCIRDYIHVEDLGTAHLAALENLWKGAPSNFYNLGSGQGFSVRQVIATVEKVTGKYVNVIEGSRRPGDPSFMVADSSKAQRELNWQPSFSSLEIIIEHTWKTLQKHFM